MAQNGPEGTMWCNTHQEYLPRTEFINNAAKNCKQCIQKNEEIRYQRQLKERKQRIEAKKRKQPLTGKEIKRRRSHQVAIRAREELTDFILKGGIELPNRGKAYQTEWNYLTNNPEYAPEIYEKYQDNLKHAETVAELRAQQLNAAEKELLGREMMRRKLLPFIKKFNRGYQAGWVHEDICERLEKFVDDVEHKRSPRLMLFMPPRHGKSEIASKNFPSWLLGKHPGWEIIASSYAVSLPIGFSRKVQANIQDPYYKLLFPNTALHPKAQSAEAWMTTKEGGYVAAGVGGGITGKGAHVFIIDDPVKDAEEADSDTQRDKVWDWWGSTAKTRLSPGGGVLVIQTRWHDDDLSGRMIKQMHDLQTEFNELIHQQERFLERVDVRKRPEDVWKAERLLKQYQEELDEIDLWEIVSYPAIAEDDEFRMPDGRIVHEFRKSATKLRSKGEALHEERYPLSRLRNMKRSMQPRHWSALYQQNPVPDEGVYFTKEMFRFTNSVPPISELKIFSAWDLAVGEKQHNDYTVGVVGGLDWQGQIHVLDMVRMRGDTHKVAQAIVATYKKYPSMMEIGIEKGQLELAIMPQLQFLMKQEKIYPTFNHELRPITDKWVRARPLQGRMQHGTVTFPMSQPWVDSAISEMLRFPGGLHDDVVDAMAWLVRMMQDVKEPPKPGVQSEKDSWKKKLNQIFAQQNGGRNHMGA